MVSRRWTKPSPAKIPFTKAKSRQFWKNRKKKEKQDTQTGDASRDEAQNYVAETDDADKE